MENPIEMDDLGVWLFQTSGQIIATENTSKITPNGDE